MRKHDTASVYLFHHDPAQGWRTALIRHPLLNAWMPPGGHVEADEAPPQAALREAAEETGLAGIRLRGVHPGLPAADTETTTHLPLPCWIAEHPIPNGDNQLAEPHVHIDYKYLGTVDDTTPVTVPDHPVGWYRTADLPEPDMLDDVRTNLGTLFSIVASQHLVTMSGDHRRN